MKSLKEIIDNILFFEKEYQLFDFTFKNYSVWAYYRMYFYYKYTNDKNVLGSSISGFKKDYKYILNILNILNVFKLIEKKEYFILEHSRSNSNKIDIYTNDIVNEIGEDKCGFFSFSNNGIINKKDKVIILDIIKIISKIISKISVYFISDDEFQKFSSFLKKLNLDNRITYISMYKRYYIELKIQYYFYYFLLKIKNTKKVILTVSYYNMPLIFAAKNLNIEVIEIQHGVISKYHLGYEYPYFKTNFFPDKLYTFSKFWNKSANFPLNTEVMESGNSFLYTNTINVSKVANTIIVVSQATIGKKLADFVIENIPDMQSYKIYFKLHPSEFNNYKIKYKNLLGLDNVNIITTENTIKELQNFCEFQIGIYSTSIYEGIEKKCKTILLNDSGIEYMDDLSINKIVTIVNYTDNLLTVLKNIEEPRDILFFDNFNYKQGKEMSK